MADDPTLEAQEAELAAWLRAAVADVLEIDADDVDADRPLTELGLSSRDGVSLVGELEDHLDRDLDPTLVFDTPTISLLARRLVRGDEPIETVPSEVSVTSVDDQGDDAIAIVGVGCRLPGGVHGPRQLWDFLMDGRDAIREVPEDRWEQFTPPTASAAAVVEGLNRWGGFLDDVSGFDADFFGISPREAELMDPQQRMLLEVAWEALQDAGVAPESLRGSQTGVFVGMSGNEYSHLTTRDLERVDAYVSTGSALSIASNRLSYLLDLRGPSMTVDTACSSSLVAMHQAIGSILGGESSTALVGGVNLVLAPTINYTFDQAGALAENGRIKAFSADADGMVRSEGCGVVVLKRLADARRDNNHVLAIVRGSAVNQDGRSNGITAPNPAAQEALLRRAYQRAGVAPGQVDYVEAHGTGTLLGDPIEASALGAVLGGEARDETSPLLLGSAKSNFGHMEAAAGILGVIKLALALYHDAIPPSLNVSEPNPRIKWDASHLRVVQEVRPWPRYGGVARGGVSGFGFGGTNAHVILEESGARNRREGGRPPGDEDLVTTLLLSGAGEQRVRDAAGELHAWLSSGAGQVAALQDVAHTLARTRPAGRVRGSVQARGREDLMLGLRSLADGLDAPNVVAPSPRMGRTDRTHGPVFVFSGFGSTWNGMGRRLLDEEPAFQVALDEIDPLVREECGWSLREAIEQDQDLRDVTKAQIVLFGMHVALARLWESYGVRPAAVIGHSVGEIAAAVVAGAIDLADGVRIITHRSILMQEENAKGLGGMAVVQLDDGEWAEIADRFPGVAIAVHASPGSITIAGPAEQLQAAAQHVEQELGRGAWVLPVTGAGHTEQVDGLLPAFGELIDGISGGTPAVSVYQTATDDPRSPTRFDVEHWLRNVRQPVRFRQAVEAAAQDGYRTFIEISPHPVAAAAAQQTLAAGDIEDTLVLPTLRRKGDDGVSFRTSLAALHAWHQLDTIDGLVRRGRKVQMPLWQHRRFWIDGAAVGHAAPQHAGHPFLGTHIALPEGGRHLWKADVGTAALPWLRDHRVHGVTVLPAAAYAEIALAAGTEVMGDGTLEVADLRLGEFLVLGDRTDITISLTIGGDDTGELAVWSDDPDGMTLRAEATVRPLVEHASAPIAHRNGTPTRAVDLDAAVLGRQVGSVTATRVRIDDPQLHDDGSAIAAVELPVLGPRDQLRHHRIHPAVVEALFQALAVSGQRLLTPEMMRETGVTEDDAFLAREIGRVALLGDAYQGGSVVARLDLDAPNRRAIGTAQLIGNDGSVITEISGIVLTRVRREDLPVGEQPDGAATGPGAGRRLVDQLASTDPARARTVLGQRLLERVAAVMAYAPDEIDVDAPLNQIGFDSLMAVRAKGMVEEDLQLELKPKLLLTGGSLADLEAAIADELGLADAGPRRVSLLPPRRRYIEPRDPTERWVAGHWHAVMGGDPPSATADFDELGGTPEQAEQILERMRERYDDAIDAIDVFGERTLERQADLLRELVEGNGGNPVRVLRTGSSDRPPLFLFHPAGGPTSVYQNLVDLLDQAQPVYGFERLEGVRTLEEKAAHYLSMIRDIAPHGPYRLAGWSLGGCLAYEVAQQLQRRGEEVEVLAMIDTTIPKATPGLSERDLLRDRFERWFAYMSETYEVPIDIDIESLVELDDEEQVRTMLRFVEDSGLEMGAGVLEHQRTSYLDARIAERYVPEPFPGRVILYRATDRGLTTTLDPRYAREEDALGWDELAGQLDIVHVPGTHITVIDEPGVRTMAEHLDGELRPRQPAATTGDET